MRFPVFPLIPTAFDAQNEYAATLCERVRTRGRLDHQPEFGEVRGHTFDRVYVSKPAQLPALTSQTRRTQEKLATQARKAQERFEAAERARQIERERIANLEWTAAGPKAVAPKPARDRDFEHLEYWIMGGKYEGQRIACDHVRTPGTIPADDGKGGTFWAEGPWLIWPSGDGGEVGTRMKNVTVYRVL